MTRKDYITIANALYDAKTKILECENPDSVEDLCDGVSYAADYLVDALAADNPRFDRDRFLKACREGC